MLRIAPLLLALLAFTGCASVATTSEPGLQQRAAEQSLREGRYRDAAMAWTDEAAVARGNARDQARLRAADAWWLDGNGAAARQALAQSNRRKLRGDDLFLHDLLTAQFLVEGGRAGDAAPLLGQPAAAVPGRLRARWHALRTQVFAAQGDAFASAGELAWQQELSGDRARRAETVREIDRLLTPLPDAVLAERTADLPGGHPLYAYAGRALTRRGLPLPRPYDRVAGLTGDENLPAAEPDGYRPPERVGVLLPLSGPLANAGASVRDGLLAGYYGESRRRPRLRFYDTAGGVEAAVAAALADDSQLLIGPLGRDEVGKLFERPDLSVPLLALNRGGLAPPPGSAAFALSPEDEGAAAAERLANRGLRRVLAITQSDDNARRALASFRERFGTRGGSLIAEVVLEEGNPDYVPALQQALARAGGRPDALFLTLKAAPARLLSAQLELAQLAGLPRVATSLILAGGNARQDGELDGIEYPELPWLLGLRGNLPEPEGLGRRLPSAQGGGARLFAFGLDAWRLAAYLDHLGRDPSAVVLGATGELRLDGFGTVLREPEWAVFSGGRPRPALDGALVPDAGAD